MKMFVKIWKDPVGSKIISSLIMIVLTAIGGVISEKWTMNGILSIFQILVPLWLLLIAYILYLLISLFLSKKQKPSFLYYKSEKNVYGYDWCWSWKKNNDGKFQICDIHPLCKECNAPMQVNIYNNTYVCSNGHSVSSEMIKFGMAASEIQRKIREKYTDDAMKYFEVFNYN